MRRSGVGSSNNSPPCVIPQAGKVPNDIGKSHREVTSDVLQHDVSRSQRANGCTDEWVEVTLIVFTFPLPCRAEWLARVTRSDHVDRLNVGPIDARHVPEVLYAGIVRG
jgi:hypothetical protein